MAGEWTTMTLREANVSLIDCDHRTPPAANTGYPYIAIPQLRAGRIDLSQVRRISRHHYIEWSRKAKPSANDVILSRRCNPGETALVPPDLECALGQNLVLLRADGTKIYPPYLRWLMRGPEWWEQINRFINVGAVFDSLKCADVPNFEFRIPPLPVQRAIAHILGTLDDKIELNRRMNETLETMARMLFKSWFVDFDPVRAKAEGRDTALPRAIADLFPNSFEDSELGEIPVGWGTHRLCDLLSLDKGLSYKGQFLTASGVPMVNLGCFLGSGKFANEAIKNYSGEYQSRHVARPFDLVIANTDITQKREVLGSPAIIPPQVDITELIFSHHVFAARFRRGQERWKLFVYFLLLQEGFRERAIGFATGTTVLALPRDALLDLQYPAAPFLLIDAFSDKAYPLLERQWKAAGESRILAALRDTLLPKLISGELRVQDVKRIIGEHA